MITPPVNKLHEILRAMPLPRAIEHIRFEITLRGHETVKADPGVFAWVNEHRSALGALARTGGLQGGAR